MQSLLVVPRIIMDATPQFKVHIAAGQDVGIPRDEMIEIIMQIAIYAGFPAALNGLFAAKKVFRRMISLKRR
jgi:4-carboxymuconolactone decarboxylase